MVIIVELFCLVVGFLLFINGWLIPFVGFTVLGLCIAGEVYAAVQRCTQKDEMTKKDLV